MNFSQRFKFSDWPNRDIPLVAAGVYAIWHGNELIYCGMSGREIEKAVKANKKKYGLITRLNSHAQGRLSGNQFCVYVANRLVIPTLTTNDLSKFATGEYKLDYMTKSYIHNNFEYQYLIVNTSSEAYAIEDKARAGELFNHKPLLNPI
ncbi:hypothetical protein RGQ13_00615 [Thalassotalea psychrophila]|uniref:GIY-YIG domain-containing protein n=1 Tax=Thalassotalea psychrophila TaxID=3065647 RepID=A0ABY9TW15_9GAMM|nr:hypothetical protein RGQ13_00615 [Colwelliaceae bacterium SQ149]